MGNVCKKLCSLDENHQLSFNVNSLLFTLVENVPAWSQHHHISQPPLQLCDPVLANGI